MTDTLTKPQTAEQIAEANRQATFAPIRAAILEAVNEAAAIESAPIGGQPIEAPCLKLPHTVKVFLDDDDAWAVFEMRSTGESFGGTAEQFDDESAMDVTQDFTARVLSYVGNVADGLMVVFEIEES